MNFIDENREMIFSEVKRKINFGKGENIRRKPEKIKFNQLIFYCFGDWPLRPLVERYDD